MLSQYCDPEKKLEIWGFQLKDASHKSIDVPVEVEQLSFTYFKGGPLWKIIALNMLGNSSSANEQ